MNKIALVIPVKGSNPKARLSSLFGPRERKQLQVAMLEDTLYAVAKAKKNLHTYVVSSDHEILQFAGSLLSFCGRKILELPRPDSDWTDLYRCLRHSSPSLS